MHSADPALPPEFWQGVEQFNHGEFYACHDTLEAIWLECYGLEKNFYQGVLQIAVACYHLSNLNWRGCAILLGEGLSRLRKYPGDYGGVNVDRLIDESVEMLLTVQGCAVCEALAEELAVAYGLRSGDAPRSRPLPQIVKAAC